jgi:hypothetical protein
LCFPRDAILSESQSSAQLKNLLLLFDAGQVSKGEANVGWAKKILRWHFE